MMSSSPESAPYIVGIAGASGVLYARSVLNGLLAAGKNVHVLISDVGRRILAEELNLQSGPPAKLLAQMFPGLQDQIVTHDIQNLGASIASGSFQTQGMVIVPCSAGTLSRISQGLSTNLMDRAAEVTLKENRKLVLVLRETPLGTLLLSNMLRVARAGATVMPANPGFYFQPKQVSDLVDFMAGRILDHLGVEHQIGERWTGKSPRRATGKGQT